MIDLRAYAKGKPCQIRVPGWCNNEPETTVGCHYRLAGYSGMSFKIDDLFLAFGCSHCHDVVDGRHGSWIEFPRSARQLLLLEGVLRTQAYLAERGIILIADSLTEAPITLSTTGE